MSGVQLTMRSTSDVYLRVNINIGQIPASIRYLRPYRRRLMGSLSPGRPSGDLAGSSIRHGSSGAGVRVGGDRLIDARRWLARTAGPPRSAGRELIWRDPSRTASRAGRVTAPSP